MQRASKDGLLAILLIFAMCCLVFASEHKNVADVLHDLDASAGQPCTVYVTAALNRAGFDVASHVPGQGYSIADAINMNGNVIKPNENLDGLVNRGDGRTKGVVAALVASGQGVEITSVKPQVLKRGDIVQYWYYTEASGKKVLEGHTAIVLGPGSGGRVRLQGSQKGKVGEIQSGFTKAIKVYAVRPQSGP